MAWAMDVPLDVVESATARHVLLVLSNYADDKGRHAFPSASTLARKTGLTLRCVRMTLATLQELNVIKRGNQAIVAAHIEQADRRPVVYDLCINGVHPVHPVEAGCISRPNGVNLTTERGESPSPKPPFNHPITDARGGARGNDAQRAGTEPSGWQPPAAQVIAAAKSDPNKITEGVAEAALADLAKELRR